MESIKTFTLVKMWLVFLDQIKRMTPRVLWLYRWAVCASSNETRRQRARSALINIDAEQRFTRGTPEYAFQILKLSDIRHIIQFSSWVKSHKATHTCCPLLWQTADFTDWPKCKPFKSSCMFCILSDLLLVELWWEAYLHFKASQRDTVH